MRISGCVFDVDGLIHRINEMEAKTMAPDFWNNKNEAREILSKINADKNIVNSFNEISLLLQDAEVMIDLAATETDPVQQSSIMKETADILSRADKMTNEIEIKALFNEPMDINNAFLTLHAGAGGTEACDWVDMLFRMYMRYCENRLFKTRILEYQPGEEAGIKSVAFYVEGPFAYGYLKCERGVHRLVRISPFDANKRRHTSFAALDVVAEISEDIEIDIKENDLKIDTYRSSGAGGQHVNKTDSAVRITHIPTGIVVACQAERSQHKNKAIAMNLLRAQLYEFYRDQKKKEMERFYSKKGEIAWGNQIRSYVLQPYTMVKDHRTGEETSNATAVLDGALEQFVAAYLKKAAKEKALTNK